jgi:hypothetical protein
MAWPWSIRTLEKSTVLWRSLAGCFMAAQTLAKAERTEEARKMLVDGIASAKKTGNGHAQSEMEGMLAELE